MIAYPKLHANLFLTREGRLAWACSACHSLRAEEWGSAWVFAPDPQSQQAAGPTDLNVLTSWISTSALVTLFPPQQAVGQRDELQNPGVIEYGPHFAHLGDCQLFKNTHKLIRKAQRSDSGVFRRTGAVQVKGWVYCGGC